MVLPKAPWRPPGVRAHFATFYLELRQALHSAVRESNSAVLLKESFSLTVRIKELLIPRASQLGIELTQLELWEAVPIGWLKQI
jgi:hypothetical protein